MDFLDIFFPKVCVSCKKFGDYICPSCFALISFAVPNRCLLCGKFSMCGLTHLKCKTKYSIDGAFCGILYSSVARRIIASLKYSPYVYKISTFLVQLTYESITQNEAFVNVLQKNPVLIPIPLFKKKIKKRGYNQSYVLAKEMGKKFNLPVVDLLTRIKDTKPQFGLTKIQRINNIKNVFDLKKEFKYQNINSAFLIDDLLTTGSTVIEAAKVLKKNGVKNVWSICMAAD